MTDQIKLAQFGLGPIGVETVKLAATKSWAEVVGAVDIDPQKTSKSLGELTGIHELRSRRVYPSFEALWQEVRPQMILHTVGSKIVDAIPQIEPMVRQGVSVVSSCEELLYPKLRAPKLAAELDALCRANGARVLGTGVNPGFVMDVLPVCLTGVSTVIHRIRVDRVVNASTRRLPLQKKIGSGLPPGEFRRLFCEGRAGHAGLKESVALIAHCLGWELSEITETCEPVVAQHEIRTAHLTVGKGLTCGLHQRAEGKRGGEAAIELDLKMYLDAPDPHDRIIIQGEPPLDVVVKGGIAGDQATLAALLNAVPRILKAPPGLLLMTDLAVPTWT